MKMWKGLAAAARGFLGNCCKKNPTDDGNLKPRTRMRNIARNALNSYVGQEENNANPNEFDINGGSCSSLSSGSEKEHSNCSSNSEALENKAVHVSSNPGLAGTSEGHLLVCFGVGIGIMSTLIPSRREVERLTCLLRQKEELIEDLEEELEMRGSWTVKDLTHEAHNSLETWRNHLGKEQGQSNAAHEADEIALVNDSVRKMENINSIEAELEAELEKLEFNLCSSNHQRSYFGISEIDPDNIADVVNGELREDGLRFNAESEEDSSFSFSVSPRDLERRLHEVIISRLQDRIVELEIELQAHKLAQKQSDELNQASQSLTSESSQGPQIAANTIYQASQAAQVCFGNGHPSWRQSCSPSNPIVQSDSSSTGQSIYHQPSTVLAQGKQQSYHINSETDSDSNSPPQPLYNQPNSSALSAKATCAINGNKTPVGFACNLDSLLRYKNVVYGEEEANQDIKTFETRFSEILNSSSYSANPNALTKDESSGKDPSPRKLNPRKRWRRGHIKTGLDFDVLVSTSAFNVIRPVSDEASSTDCISPCPASITCSEINSVDIPIIDPELDKFITDSLMDFGMDSEGLGSVATLLD